MRANRDRSGPFVLAGIVGMILLILVLGRSLPRKGEPVPEKRSPASILAPSTAQPGPAPVQARPRPFGSAAPDDYDTKEYMYALLEAEKASPSLTPQQAEQMLQLFLGAHPDLRASRDLYALSAEILTEKQRAFLDLELDFYKPPTRPEREAFYARLREAAGVRDVERMALPAAIVRNRKNVPYLDLVSAHFEEMQEDGALRLSPDQMRRLLPYYRYFLDFDVCPTTDTCLGEIMTEAQREAVADVMVGLTTLRGRGADVEPRFMSYLRSRVDGQKGPPPATAQASPPAPARIEIPSRGSLQERQMSRGVYIAGTDLGDLVACEAAFHEGLRLFLDYLETRDRARLEKALAAFQRTNDHPLNRFRRYSFYYQAYCQELLGSTEARDLYVSKGWIAPGQYEFFFAGDVPGMTRYLLRTFCRENVEALQAARKLYAADHGQAAPATLAELVPRYLNRVPSCPAGEMYSAATPLVCGLHREPGDLFDPEFFVYWTILEDYAEQDRFATWNPLLLKASDLKPGEVVADLGCGRGLFTFSLAERVGPRGQVYAVDINPGVLKYVDFEARRHPELRVKTVLGTESDVGLPAGSLDVAFLVAVYHNLVPRDAPRDPENLRKNLLPWLGTVHRALKPGGRFVIQDGKVDPEIVREQVCQAGFEHLPDRVYTPKLEKPSLTVFRKR